MTATFFLGVVIGLMTLVRQIHWVAMAAVLVAIGYFAHTHLDNWRLDNWPHEERQDRTNHMQDQAAHIIILRP